MAEARLVDTASRLQPQGRILEVFFFRAHALLVDPLQTSPQRAIATQALADHGFEHDRLPSLPLGFYLSAEAMRAALAGAGFATTDISTSRLLADTRLPGRVLGAINNCHGQVQSLWAWDPQASGHAYLYLDRHWRRRVPAFGLDIAIPAVRDTGRELLLVEDFLDALLLQSKGFLHTAALGGPLSELGVEPLQALADLGVREIVLAITDQQESQIDALCRRAAGARPSIEIRAVPGLTAHGVRSAAELVRRHGAASLWELLRRLPPAPVPAAVIEAQPLVVETAPAVVVPPPPKPAPVESMQSDSELGRWALRNRRPGRQCELHQCGRYDCFCFD